MKAVLDSRMTDRATGFEHRVYRVTKDGETELFVEAVMHDPSNNLETDADADEFVRKSANAYWSS